MDWSPLKLEYFQAAAYDLGMSNGKFVSVNIKQGKR